MHFFFFCLNHLVHKWLCTPVFCCCCEISSSKQCLFSRVCLFGFGHLVWHSIICPSCNGKPPPPALLSPSFKAMNFVHKQRRPACHFSCSLRCNAVMYLHEGGLCRVPLLTPPIHCVLFTACGAHFNGKCKDLYEV